METKQTPKPARLALLSPRTGQPMSFFSRLTPNPDGSFWFLVGSRLTGERYKVTVRVEEIYEHRRPAH